MGIPLTTKKFLWRACLDILPTKVNLCKRKILIDQTCPLCLVELETTEHILWDCISASDILRQCTRRIQKGKASCNNFKSLIEDMFNNLEIEEMEELTLILWNLWRRRNEYVFKNILIGPKGVLHRVSQMKQDLSGL